MGVIRKRLMNRNSRPVEDRGFRHEPVFAIELGEGESILVQYAYFIA